MALNKATLVDVFEACQKSVTAHKRGWQRCLELQDEDREGFRDEFIQHVNRLLIVWKREPAVERLCKFVVHFVTTPDQQKGPANESLFLQLIKHLLEASNANDKAVRFRTSDLIASMMNQLDEEAELECVPPRPSALP